LCDGCAVLGIEVGVDFVEEVEWGRVALLDGEDEGKGAQTLDLLAKKELQGRMAYTLLSTTQLLNSLLLIMLAVEGHADTNTGIVLYTLARLVIRVFFFSCALISLALDDQSTTTSWNQSLENRSELLGDLLECSLDCLILSLI
jgi:hypothetical protein